MAEDWITCHVPIYLPVHKRTLEAVRNHNMLFKIKISTLCKEIFLLLGFFLYAIIYSDAQIPFFLSGKFIISSSHAPQPSSLHYYFFGFVMRILTMEAIEAHCNVS